MEFTDEEILKLIASDRDFEKGFSVLVKKYQEKLYWNIRRMVHVHQDADDVLQNVFLKVFKGIKGFKKDAKLFTWLYKISVNESITFLNKKKKKVSLSLEEHVGHLEKELKADTYFNGDDMQLQLIKAIEHLPEKQKLVFNMRYYDEMKYKEMSDVLETSAGALKASYHHAVKKIESHLKKGINYV